MKGKMQMSGRGVLILLLLWGSLLPILTGEAVRRRVGKNPGLRVGASGLWS